MPTVLATLFVAVLLVLPGCLNDPAGPAVSKNNVDSTPDPELLAALTQLAKMPELRLETDHGTIRILLYDTWLPETNAHIAALADAGFYDGTLIHRVVDDFVIQGGDPSGTGQLGSGDTVPLELDPRLHFAAGSVGLARDLDPDSGDSQWFIAETPQPHLTDPQGTTGQVFGTYSLFGQLFEGLDVVRAIAAEPVIPGADRPITDVTVRTAHMLPPPETDVLNLVRAIEDPVEWSVGFGVLDRPIWPVAAHPLRLRVHDEEGTGDGFDPLHSAWYLEGQPDVPLQWTPTSDPGTWETTATFPAAGTWTLAATDVCRDPCQRLTLDVLPWSPAYEAYR